MSIVENLQKLLASGRDDPMVRFGLGSAYFNQSKFDLAIPHLEVCIEQDENYSAAYKLLGKALLKSGEIERAKIVFERGLTIARAAGDKQTEKEIAVFLKKSCMRRHDG